MHSFVVLVDLSHFDKSSNITTAQWKEGGVTLLHPVITLCASSCHPAVLFFIAQL